MLGRPGDEAADGEFGLMGNLLAGCPSTARDRDNGVPWCDVEDWLAKATTSGDTGGVRIAS